VADDLNPAGGDLPKGVTDGADKPQPEPVPKVDPGIADVPSDEPIPPKLSIGTSLLIAAIVIIFLVAGWIINYT